MSGRRGLAVQASERRKEHCSVNNGCGRCRRVAARETRAKDSRGLHQQRQDEVGLMVLARGPGRAGERILTLSKHLRWLSR
jgi:hypothetical protein